MAGTRRSPRADEAGGAALVAAVDRTLASCLRPGSRIVVALSGGRDSVALLHALIDSERIGRADLVAVHVHHGLSPQAERWAEFCRDLAASHAIEFELRRVDARQPTGEGIEATARSLRYQALRSAARAFDATTVALAHHQDDQAETLLLQLIRGAGVRGLSAMTPVRDVDGVRWLRPLLDVPRSDIEAFVRARALRYVDDDSNASDRHARNALRRHVVPAIARIRGGYPTTIARAAAHQAEAARLADDLANLDARDAIVNGALGVVALQGLPAHRARNLLRHYLHSHGLRAPSTARLAGMLAQLVDARHDARIVLRHDGAVIGASRGRIVVHADPPPAYRCEWHGEAFVELPHGRLAFVEAHGTGLAVRAARDRTLVVRPRTGGERLQPHAGRPRRALKSWLRESGLPWWEREALPLLFDGDTLVAVPGIGVDIGFKARPGEPGYALEWQPLTPRGT